jgi:hypothetical protein
VTLCSSSPSISTGSRGCWCLSNSTCGLRRETWKTSWIDQERGIFSLIALSPINSKISYGLAYLAENFFSGCRTFRFLVLSHALSPTVYLGISETFLLKNCSILSAVRARAALVSSWASFRLEYSFQLRGFLPCL